MITPNAAKAVRDNMMEGAAKLRLPMSKEMLRAFTCDSLNECKLNHCPVCAAHMNMRLLELDGAQIAFDFKWRQHVYALRDFTIAADDDRGINLAPLHKELKNALNRWARSAKPHAEDEANRNWGCIATYGLVQDLGSQKGLDKVATVEIALTGGDRDADYDIYEALSEFGGSLEQVPLPLDGDHRLAPNQGLLFGYTKRDLGKPDRPKVIYNKQNLARMHSNYAGSPDELRLLSLGIEKKELTWILADDGYDGISSIFPII